jgi:hypothetical protein
MLKTFGPKKMRCLILSKHTVGNGVNYNLHDFRKRLRMVTLCYYLPLKLYFFHKRYELSVLRYTFVDSSGLFRINNIFFALSLNTRTLLIVDVKYPTIFCHLFIILYEAT